MFEDLYDTAYLPDQDQLDWLARQGVSGQALVNVGLLNVRGVCFGRGGRFQFDPNGKQSFIIPAVDGGQIVDAVAFTVHEFASLNGAAFCLGADQLSGWSYDPVPVWRHPLGWLRAECDGICLLRPDWAWSVLTWTDEVMAEDDTHVQELRDLLTPPATKTRVLLRERVAA